MIAILPIITKLFEICILKKLKEEIDSKAPISKMQRGFIEGGSTIQNLNDVYCEMEQAQRRIKEAQDRGVPVGRRCKEFLHFTDMSVAFDSI